LPNKANVRSSIFGGTQTATAAMRHHLIKTDRIHCQLYRIENSTPILIGNNLPVRAHDEALHLHIPMRVLTVSLRVLT
jgi:hypothetical protein